MSTYLYVATVQLYSIKSAFIASFLFSIRIELCHTEILLLQLNCECAHRNQQVCSENTKHGEKVAQERHAQMVKIWQRDGCTW